MNGRLHGLAAVVLSSFAATAHASGPPVPALVAQAYAGLEVSDTDSFRVDVGGEWNLPRDWKVGLDASKADYGLPGEDVSSTVVSAIVRHDFESFQLGAGVSHSELDERSSTRSILVTSSYWKDDWRFQAGLGSRQTKLGTTQFEEDLGGGIGLASGVSRCDARSLSAHAHADLVRTKWRLYARAVWYDYRDVDCALTLSVPANGNGNGNGPPVHARGRALGLRLVTNTLESVVGINPRLIPRDAMLLESGIALGAAVSRPSGWQFGGEIYRDVDWLRGRDFFTAVTYGNREIAHNWNMELSLGYATSSLEDSLFAGIRMTASIY